MKVLHYILMLPLVVFAAWFIYAAEAEDGISFAPWIEEHFNTKLVLVLCIIYGYLCGKVNTWFNYHRVRRDLRLQKRSNRELNKEQTKLNETVKDLQQNLAGLQEHAKIQENLVTSKVNFETRGLIDKITDKFSKKKG